MSLIAVSTAFDLRLRSFVDGAVNVGHKADLQVEGTIYTPKSGRPFYSSRMSAYTATPLGTGPDPVVQERGIYQISINRPGPEGMRVAGLIAADLAAYFKRAQLIAAVPNAPAQKSITIEYATEMPPTQADDWIVMPVLVHWFTLA